MIKKLNILAFIMIVAVWTAVAYHSFNYNPSEKLAIIPGISENLKRLAAKDPGKMTDKEKEEFASEIRKDRRATHEIMESKVIPEEVKKNIQNNLHLAFKVQMMKRIDEYFSLSESDRDAYLEKMMAEMRPPMGGGPDGRPRGGGGGNDRWQRRGPSLSRIKEHIESSTPAERAKMQEFHRQMRAKRGSHQSPPR